MTATKPGSDSADRPAVASAADTSSPVTVAEAYLVLLRQHGIENLYVNAGTDFAPLVEAYAKHRDDTGRFPRPVVATHENVAAGMAHGAYLMTSRPQAVMFHVSVGTANAICAVINAARDNVPILVTAGRTPIMEDGVVGARDTSIHWAQEMYDQAGMLREFVKWDYELRDGRQLETVLARAFNVANAEPKGPVYLSLPREVLAAAAHVAGGAGAGSIATPTVPQPDAAAVELLADRLAAATMPTIVTSGSGAALRVVEQLGDLCDRFAIGVAEAQPRYVNVRADHPLHLGYRVGRVLADADVVCFLDCDVPWIAAQGAPRDETFIVQCGVDPLYGRYPMRSHRSDLTITSSTTSLLDALAEALAARRDRIDPTRRDALAQRSHAERKRLSRVIEREVSATGPISKALVALTLADALDDDTIVFNEYWVAPQLLGTRPAGSYFFMPPSGGLGWGLPAALGAKHAAPHRTVVAAVGDGSYLFANPAACHHAAEKHGLPVLTIVANNAAWGAVDAATRAVYPDGDAVGRRELRLSNLSPSPAFEHYAHASGGYGERVETRDQLRPALDRAMHAVRSEGRQALLNVICAEGE